MKYPLLGSEVLEDKRLEDIGRDVSMTEKIDTRAIVQTVDILYLRNKTVIIFHICNNPI